MERDGGQGPHGGGHDDGPGQPADGVESRAERCAQELPTASPQFHVVETPTAVVLLHYEDHP